MKHFYIYIYVVVKNSMRGDSDLYISYCPSICPVDEGEQRMTSSMDSWTSHQREKSVIFRIQVELVMTVAS
jgi:hypothetical protein